MILVRNLYYSSSYLFLTNQLHLTALAIQFCKRPCSSFKPVTMNDNYKYEPGTSSVAFVTAPDDKIAKKIAKGLIEQKLAACVNIIPNIQSVYMWEGKLNEDCEYLMMIKTRTSRLVELSKWVRDNHPYSVAEVITLPIEQGNFPYMKWLSESVPE